jgi:hypothetical protein
MSIITCVCVCVCLDVFVLSRGAAFVFLVQVYVIFVRMYEDHILKVERLIPAIIALLGSLMASIQEHF